MPHLIQIYWKIIEMKNVCNEFVMMYSTAKRMIINVFISVYVSLVLSVFVYVRAHMLRYEWLKWSICDNTLFHVSNDSTFVVFFS